VNDQLGIRRDRDSLAPVIQHTLISADVTLDRVVAHAEECLQWGFNAAMIAGSWVREAVAVLSGSPVLVASALDFPIVGIMTSQGKAAEAAQLVKDGAQQLDIGCQIGWLKSGRYDAFREDIAGVVRASGVPIKVMLELPLLSPQEREAAVELAMDAGAVYLKNASSGAVEVANAGSVRWLAERAREGVLVKASGGITTATQVEELVQAGAALVGTSAGVSIVLGTSDASTRSY